MFCDQTKGKEENSTTIPSLSPGFLSLLGEFFSFLVWEISIKAAEYFSLSPSQRE